MFTILQSAARIAAFVALAAALAACGDEEPAQRKAFIAFLQDINGAGSHVLKPTAKDEKDFGPYLQQYQIVLSYNADMRAATEAMAAPRQNRPRPAFHAVHHRADAAAPQDLAAARQEVERFEHETQARLTEAKARRDGLKQPDDLKAVYDKAFNKLVTTPTLAFENSAKALRMGLTPSIKLADYINSHRTKLSVAGMQVQARDQRTLDEIGALLKAHAAAGEKFAAAQRDGERLVNGR